MERSRPLINSSAQYRDRDRDRGVRRGGPPTAQLLHFGVGGDDEDHDVDHLPRAGRSLLPHRRPNHSGESNDI